MGRFVEVHGTSYSYSRFVYVEMHTVGIVTCKLHGDFPMSPANHLTRHGCPSCWQNTASKPEIAWLAAIAEATGWLHDGAVKMPAVTGVVDSVFEHPNLGKIVIEYDGNYWHSRPGDLDRDTAKTARLIESGFPVARLRAISKDKPPLADVPGAVNVFISEWPDSAGVQAVVAALNRMKAP
ncbi:hypothetical protein [Arthrobacter methylotrophus]|uniref:DUF559 domain-containing protein n=1 Tax=Arthrobacter methylotrophus TaxID=121291 RepID=A0ABV5UNT6_9MICC